MHSPKTDMSRALTFQLTALLFLGSVFASGCIVHDGRHGRGHGGPIHVEPLGSVSVAPAPIVFTFSDHHRHSVREYYSDDRHRHGKKHKWKRGRGRGQGHRPPGLRRHDVYPSGVQMQALPPGLARQMPHAPRGTRYVYYGDQVLLVDIRSHVIVDFIDISVGF